MAKEITKLTDEQKAQMPAWVEKWIKVGWCTDEADWEAFALGARACYGYANIPWHGRVIRVGNPLVGAFVAPILASGKVRAGVRAEVSAGVSAGVSDGVRAGVWDGVRDGVSDGVWAGVSAGVRAEVSAGVRAEVSDGVSDGVWDGVWDGVSAGVSDEVSDGVWDGVWDGVSQYLGGHLWVDWQSYTSFFRDVVGLQLPGDLWDRDRAYALAQSSAGWWWPYRHFLVVSDRPRVLHVDQFRPGQYRMHCETGPAIAYRDGWGLHFLEGVRVASHVVERPDTITIAEIQAEKNAETRRILTQQYGLLRYMRDMGAKALDSRFGEALFADPQTGWRWLVCTDGSTGRIYQIRVPQEVENVRQAQIALNGVDPGLMLARS